MDYFDVFRNLKGNYKYSRKSPEKAVLLLAVINLFEQGKISDNEIKETFINKVLEYGFNPETDFQKNKYTVDKITLFEVKDSFPRLTEKDIKYQEIDNVTYEIIIRTIEKYKVEEI